MGKEHNNYGLITDLIRAVEEFERTKSSAESSIAAFALWLSQRELVEYDNKTALPKSLDDKLLKRSNGVGFQTAPINVQFSLLLTQLSRHFKLYSKKVLLDSDLVSMDGHMFLASLYSQESLKKTELIKMHYMEMPSGIEVIKRLLKKGFIEEFDDEEDRRAKRVKITSKGKKEFEATLPEIRKVIHLMAGDLNDRRKVELVGILDELNEFHNSKHEEVKRKSLDELLS